MFITFQSICSHIFKISVLKKVIFLKRNDITSFISIPLHHGMTTNDQEKVISCPKRILLPGED